MYQTLEKVFRMTMRFTADSGVEGVRARTQVLHYMFCDCDDAVGLLTVFGRVHECGNKLNKRA